VQALNDRSVSHCLYAHGSVPPYGYVTLLAGSGQYNCEQVWREWSRPPL
jgi:hypothetical protein